MLGCYQVHLWKIQNTQQLLNNSSIVPVKQVNCSIQPTTEHRLSDLVAAECLVSRSVLPHFNQDVVSSYHDSVSSFESSKLLGSLLTKALQYLTSISLLSCWSDDISKPLIPIYLYLYSCLYSLHYIQLQTNCNANTEISKLSLSTRNKITLNDAIKIEETCMQLPFLCKTFQTL